MSRFWVGIGAAIGIFVGMVLHEYAHARAALIAGDRTPQATGRVTLNPKAHVDPLGTIIIPALFIVPMLVGQSLGGMVFGYAKPVTTNPRNMRNPRRDHFLVALAGPVTNLALAVVAGAALHQTTSGGSAALSSVLAGIVTVNVFLAIINSLPIPPLDGSKVLGLVISPQAVWRLEELSQYFLLFLVVLFLFFGRVIGAMADPICRAASLSSLGGCPL